MSREEAYNELDKLFKSAPKNDQIPMSGGLIHKISLEGTAILMNLIRCQIQNPKIEESGGWMDIPFSYMTKELGISRKQQKQIYKLIEKLHLIKITKTQVWINFEAVKQITNDFAKIAEQRLQQGWISLREVEIKAGELRSMSTEEVRELAYQIQYKGLAKIETDEYGFIWIKVDMKTGLGIASSFQNN